MRKSLTGIRLAAAALLLAPLIAHSAGLGQLTVQSALGQPLVAEIEIVSLQPGEEDSLTARLASPEAFRQAGMEMSSALIGVQLAVQRRDGRSVIRISSERPVSEPFLDVLVELQWATGRLVREYTFLLDPPEFRKPPAVAAAPAPTPAAKPAAAAPVPAKPAVEARPIAATPAKAAATHEVKKGETLGGIARKNAHEGVTLNQMLIALYRANQDAFIRGNINLVRAGRILDVPGRDAAAAIGEAEASRLVRSQMADFAEYRRKLGAVVAAAPAAPAAREREVTGRIGVKPEPAAPAEPKDQLKLSKADGGKAAARAARDDDRVARDRALKESQSRISQLEKNVADLQKLLEVKNRQLAELEKKGVIKPAPAAPEPVKPAPAAKAPEPAKAAAEAPKPAAEAPKPAAEAPKPAAEAPKPAAPAPKPAAEAPKKPAAAPPKPAPEVSILDEFLDNPAALGGLGGVIALLVGYGVWAWRSKKAAQSKFQDSVLGAAGGAPGESVLGAPQGGAAAAAEAVAPSVAAAVSVPSVGAAEAEEVDPIAEADVYMAYGRDAQAEEILKEALAKDANRVPVHAKLLEIYASRRDAKAFEQTALKVGNLTGNSGPEWAKAQALGRTVDPGNSLYGAGEAAPAEAAAPAAPAAEAPALDFDIGGGGEAPAAPVPQADTTAALDFDLGGAPAAEEKSDFAPGGTLIIEPGEAQAATTTIDFDLGGAAAEQKPAGGLDIEFEAPAEKPAAPAPASADPDATVALGAMNFDLNLDLGGGKKEEAAPAAAAPLDLGSISLDLEAPAAPAAAPGGDAKWQEVATKLDLAKAYEEMGDKDGARELLNEVMKEGDAAQQAQAQQMLANLG